MYLKGFHVAFNITWWNLYKSFDFSWNLSWRRSFSKLFKNSSSEIKLGRKQHLNGSVYRMQPFSEQNKIEKEMFNNKLNECLAVWSKRPPK